MKIKEHGYYYKHEIEVRCEECVCRYLVNNIKDISVYDKPVKVIVGSIDCNWLEKRNYFTICPECWHCNPMTDRDYEIVSKRVAKNNENN